MNNVENYFISAVVEAALPLAARRGRPVKSLSQSPQGAAGISKKTPPR
ncbi:hypothetical protein [Dyella mobilis]|uniref:Uncharacterized protein n=1 Tax=Dyella mobilis TaxID=1849582 RepID=A0ABS2KJM1_9GAMM|nr:hypothetical protein [Dyella mobilis]MBM7131355.1 hypothetical protein [Dyella mobilis]